MSRPTPEQDLTHLFAEVDLDWDLQALYDDLEDVKHSCLTEMERMCLRGLLHYGSRTKLTEKLRKDPKQLREYLHQNVYPLVGTLVGCKDGEVASSRIPQWLKEKGYRRPVPVESAAETSPSSLSPWVKKMAIGGVGLALTIATGVVVEILTGVFTDQFAGDAEKAGVVAAPDSQSLKVDAKNFGEIDAPSGIFNYGGSTSWAVIRAEVDPEIQAAHPDFQLRYVDPIAGNPGSEVGIKMLLNDQLSFAQSSRPIENEEYKQAKERGFQLKSVPVAIDGIAVAVRPDLDVDGITVVQLRDIYLGRITNWKDVGGPDLAIVPLSRELDAGGTVNFFMENVLGGQPFGPAVKTVASTSLALRELGNSPGGIYYASAPSVVPQCTVKALALGRKPDAFVSAHQEPYVPPSECPSRRNQLNVEAFQQGDYPITRRMFVVIKKSDRMDRLAGEAYATLMLSREGQDAIAKAGFVPIR